MATTIRGSDNFNTNNVATQTELDNKITATGAAPIYACRAWVNFNGTGTVAIRASGNVSSITDNGTGDYTVNFTSAMSDANFASTITAGAGTHGRELGWEYFQTAPVKTTTSARFRTGSPSIPGAHATQYGDSAVVNVTVFR